jgi:methionyl-tRNA synthetase
MLLDQQISWARARKVSKALKSVGYGKATIAFCYKTVRDLTKALYPITPEVERQMAEFIMQAAGFKPKQQKKE